MKSEMFIPTDRQKLKGLNQLQGERLTADRVLETLSLVRWDPRLSEEFIRRLALDWRRLSVSTLFALLRKSEFRGLFGLLAEFGEDLVVLSDWPEFRAWRLAVVPWRAPKSYQIYNLCLFKFAGRSMRREAAESLPIFKKWGFLARDPLINKASARMARRTRMAPWQRRQVLHELVSEGRPFTVTDYLRRLNGLVTRRVAELDLRAAKDLKAQGQTRLRLYQVKPKA